MESYVRKEMDAAEVDVPLRGTFSGDPFEALPLPLLLGIHLSSHTLRAIHESTVSSEACSLACKMVGSLCSARLLKDYFQASLLHVNFKIVNVSFLGRGFFRVQFESASRAMEVLAQGPMDFHFAIGFLAKWTHGMDLNGLEGGTAVTARFPGLLPEFPRMKGHVAAACTRRRISPDQRQQASKQEALHANGGLDDRLVRRRSEAEKDRRKGRKDDDELGRQRLQSLCISEEKMFLLSPRILLLLHHLFMIRHPTLMAQVWISAAVLKA
ncbi:hypothetical protein L7F22_046363 [Adiantum nelumboides]|nr:hypothetical protein [Adiantum nelumboides]